MATRCARTLCGVSLALLVACGGGGGTGDAPPLSSALATQLPGRFAGTFASGCDAVDSVIVAATGEPANVRSFLTVGETSQGTAAVSLRLVFHLDADCGTPAVAQLAFADPDNSVRFDDEVVIDGRAAQRVTVTYGGTREGTLRSDGLLQFGDSAQLLAPAELRERTTFGDVWLREGDLLYEGGLARGADGYPLGLEWGSSSRLER